METPALAGSVLVHGAAMLVSLLGPEAAPRAQATRPESPDIAFTAISLPRLILFSGRDTAHIDPDRGGTIVRLGCPPDRPVSHDAAPNFPVSGPNEPLAWLREMPRNPSFCARIGADGRITAIRLNRSSGDPSADAAILATLRTLPFRPAWRDARPATAWHQVVVNRFPSRP